MKMKSYTVLLKLRHLFLWSSGHSVEKKNRRIVEEVWTMTEKVVTSRPFQILLQKAKKLLEICQNVAQKLLKIEKVAQRFCKVAQIFLRQHV